MAHPGVTVRQAVVRLDAAGLRPIGGRPVLGWIVRELQRFGVDDVIFLSQAADFSALPALGPLPKPARMEVLPCPGGDVVAALAGAGDRLHGRFLLCGGNTLFDANLGALLAGESNNSGRRLIVQASDSADGFADIMLIRKEALRSAGMATDLPAVVVAGAIGDHALPRLRRPALFFDRDGVLNLDHGYIGTRDRFEWVENALAAIEYATRAGWHVFITTNQSGVARGHYDEAAVRLLLDWMADEARARGGTIDDARYCPYHPEAQVAAYRQAHPWRKPEPGMLLDLIGAWELDATRAIMIGDQDTDMQAAAAAGIDGHLFRGGDLLAFLRPILDRKMKQRC